MPYEAINHSPEAVRVAQYTASFFVQVCILRLRLPCPLINH
jgi:hypothetical protein